jgi:hypothetical protein
LPSPTPPKDVERVALGQRPVLLGDVARGGIGELVGLADHEVGEGVARLRALEDLVASATDRRPEPRHRLLEVLRAGTGGMAMMSFGTARRRRRHQVDLDAGHLRVDRLPVGEHAVAVVRLTQSRTKRVGA